MSTPAPQNFYFYALQEQFTQMQQMMNQFHTSSQQSNLNA
jgi:hypothetical protein